MCRKAIGVKHIRSSQPSVTQHPHFLSQPHSFQFSFLRAGRFSLWGCFQAVYVCPRHWLPTEGILVSTPPHQLHQTSKYSHFRPCSLPPSLPEHSAISQPWVLLHLALDIISFITAMVPVIMTIIIPVVIWFYEASHPPICSAFLPSSGCPGLHLNSLPPPSGFFC